MQNLLRAGALALLFMLACGEGVAQEKPVCVLLAPMTGHLARVGEVINNSVRLKSDELQSPILWELEDTQYSPQVALTIVRQLVQKRRMKCAIVFGSPVIAAVGPLLDQAKIPSIGISFTESPFKGRSHIYRFFPAVGDMGNLFRKEVKRRAYSKAALLTSENEATVSLRDALGELSEAKVVLDATVPVGDFDVRGIALRVISAAPDAVFLNLVPPHTGLMAKMLRQQGYTGELFGSLPLKLSVSVDIAGGALSGAWVAQLRNSAYTELSKRYVDRFHSPFETEGALAYDATQLLVDGFGSGRSVAEYLSGLPEFAGALGISVRRDNSFDVPVEIGLIE